MSNQPCSSLECGTQTVTLPAKAYQAAERYHIGPILYRYQPSIRKTTRTLLFCVLMALITFSVVIIDYAHGQASSNLWWEWGRLCLFVLVLPGAWIASLTTVICAARLTIYFFWRYEVYMCCDGFFVMQRRKRVTTVIYWCQVEELLFEQWLQGARRSACSIRCKDGATLPVSRKLWKHTRDELIQRYAGHLRVTIEQGGWGRRERLYIE